MKSWKQKTLLASIESTYGQDANPAATDAVLAIDVSLSPMEGNDITRETIKPYLGNDPSIPSELHHKLSFKVEYAGSGTSGIEPAWGVLLRACGVAEVITVADPDNNVSASVAYNPVSDAHESLSLHFVNDGTQYVLKGARGNVKLTMSAENIPYLEFEFTGLYSTPTEVAMPVPVYTDWQDPLISNSTNTPTFTINGSSFVMRDFNLDLGNSVENRFLIGSESVLITDKADMVNATVEAVALTTFDPFTLSQNQTRMPIELVHGTSDGHRLSLSVPNAQIKRLSGLQDAQNIVEWPLGFSALPSTGNDQWTLTLT